MATIRDLRVFFFAFLFLACPLVQVVRGETDAVPEETVDAVVEGANDLGFVGDESQDFGEVNLSPAPGVDTVCIFPKNSARLVTAGEETELLVGLKNDGESSLNIIGIKASVHLPVDHSYLVQNLTGQAFTNATVPASAQATFSYIFAVSPYLQPGTFDLEGVIIYEIEEQPFQSTFFNGTIEVVEAGGFLAMESVLLVTFGVGLLGLLGLWVHSQIQNFSKKSKKATKVEVGTATTDASMDEWLQGTAYTQSAGAKSKKKSQVTSK